MHTFLHYDQNAIGKLGTWQSVIFFVGFSALLNIEPLRVRDPCSLDHRRMGPLMTVKKTILCVDDEQSLSIQRLTLETRGYRVVTCTTAVEAISLFNHRGVDLVLSNFELPDAHATDMAKRIKALAPETPVVLVSAQNWTSHSDAPVDLLLRKGTYAPADLLERIRLLLVKRRGPRRATTAVLASPGRAC